MRGLEPSSPQVWHNDARPKKKAVSLRHRYPDPQAANSARRAISREDCCKSEISAATTIPRTAMAQAAVNE
jgi:hypothetical protein